MLNFERLVDRVPGSQLGTRIRAHHFNELQQAAEDLQAGALPIALAGIEGALGEYEPLQNMREVRRNVLDFGADPTGDSDCVDAIHEAAADARDALQSGSAEAAGLPILEFPPGAYRITDELSKGSEMWIGTGARNGSQLIWDGGSGGTMVTQSGAAPAAISFGGMRNLWLTSASTSVRPDHHLDLTASTVDALYQLEQMYFSKCEDTSIVVSGWTNLHWSHIRWDSIREYAISLLPDSTQFGSSFVLDQFTYDHQGASDTGKGFLLIDNQKNSVNVGPIKLSNARVEVNHAWDSPASLIHLKHGSTANPSIFPILLENLAFVDEVSTNPGVIYRDTADTTNGEQVTLDNVVLSQSIEVCRGTWPNQFGSTPPAPASGRIPYMQIGEQHTLGSPLYIYRGTLDTVAIRAERKGDTVNRFRLSPDGKQEWGDGSNAVDTNLYRDGVGRLRTDGTFMLPGTYLLPLRLGSYRLWVDPGTDKLYIKNGAPSSATDGTVVGTQS